MKKKYYLYMAALGAGFLTAGSSAVTCFADEEVIIENIQKENSDNVVNVEVSPIEKSAEMDSETRLINQTSAANLVDDIKNTDEELNLPAVNEIKEGWNETKDKYYTSVAYLSGEQEIDGTYYYFNLDDNTKVSNAFIDFKVDEDIVLKKYYTQNGTRAEGQLKIEDSWYYFDPKNQGYMAVGETYIDPDYNHGNGKWVFYANNGQMQYGQVKIGENWKYFDQYSGQRATGITKIPAAMNHGKEKWVYYDDEGCMQYGQFKIKGHWQYFDQYSGQRAVGEVMIPAAMNHGKAKWVCYDDNGNMIYGQKKISGSWKYFDEYSGQRAVGETLIPASMNYGNAKWVYYDDQGRMQYGQIKVQGKWKYFDEYSGQRAVGETTIPASMNHGTAKTVFYNNDGSMFYGLKSLNGNYKFYHLDTGALTKGVVYLPAYANTLSSKSAYKYFDSQGNLVKNSAFACNHNNYYADGNGDLKTGNFSKGNIDFYADAAGKIQSVRIRNIQYLSQKDGRWSYKVIGNSGDTLYNIGCVPSTMSMIINWYNGTNIRPDQLAQQMNNAGVWYNLTSYSVEWAARNNNLKMQALSSKQAFKEALLKGQLVAGTIIGQPWVAGNIDHEMLFCGYDNGRTYVYDPYSPSLNGWYTLDHIWSVKSNWYRDTLLGGPFFAIYK